MSIKVENAEQAEALVNTLQIEGSGLNDANLSGLSSTDLEQLADLQAELDSINTSDIETEIEVKQMLDEDIVETEIGGEEVVIESEDLERSLSPDEILPHFKEHHDESIEEEEENKGDQSSVPPLRPLTIAPKPTTMKMPLKAATVVSAGSGQQIVLIQSPGGTASTVNLTGQQFKLLTSQAGQSLAIPNLQNVQIAKTSTSGATQSGQIVQLRAIPKTESVVAGTQSTTATLKTMKKIAPHNKNIIAKVIQSQGQQPQQIKLVQQPSSGTMATKTITLAQAQQMGLIPQSPTKQIVLNKSTVQGKTIKVVPQLKSPTKILPAPITQTQKLVKSGLQRVIIKQTGGNSIKPVSTNVPTSVITSGSNQVIRLPAGTSAGQIHQINVPGKGLQFIRFLPTASNTSTITKESTSTAGTTQKTAQVVPVAGITVNRMTTSKVSGSNNSGQNIIKVVPISGTQTRPVVPKPLTTTQRVLIPASGAQTRPTQTLATIPAATLSQLQGAIIPSNNSVGQIVMLPAQYVHQIQNQSTAVAVAGTTGSSASKSAATAKTPTKQSPIKISPTQLKEPATASTQTLAAGPDQRSSPSPEGPNYSRTLEPNGIRPRKPCNCTKSLCLKLYCDCFANGEFCYLCNCMNCYNNLEKEEERQRAIRNCLERNPNAFRPKIGKGRDAGEASIRKHTKGCNCKRSGCLKNYCECYEAKIACSSNCKCIGCRNIEDSMEKKSVRSITALPPDQQLQVVPTAKSKASVGRETSDLISFRPLISTTSTKLPSTYMTNEVIEATTQCLIAQADESERSMLTEEAAKRMILEEFGRCLVQIIECSKNKTTTNL